MLRPQGLKANLRQAIYPAKFNHGIRPSEWFLNEYNG